jgi:hypothetical protein
VEVGWVRFGEQAGRVTHPACVDAYCAYEAWRNRNTLFSGGHDFQVDQTSHFMPGDAPSFRVFANAIYDPADITWRGQWSADGVEWHDIPGVEPATFPCGQQMHELFSGVETVGQQPAGNVGLHLHATNMYIGCPQLQLTEWLYSEVLDYGLGPEHWNVTPVGASDWIMTTWP